MSTRRKVRWDIYRRFSMYLDDRLIKHGGNPWAGSGLRCWCAELVGLDKWRRHFQKQSEAGPLCRAWPDFTWVEYDSSQILMYIYRVFLKTWFVPFCFQSKKNKSPGHIKKRWKLSEKRIRSGLVDNKHIYTTNSGFWLVGCVVSIVLFIFLEKR